MPADQITILVVDDFTVDRVVARRLLEKHDGWRVAQAADGAEALEAIASAPPALVLTDLQMPGINGLVLVEQVRERFPHVPVVLMTGHESETIAIAALRAGAASYVPKRNFATDLLPTVEQVLAVARRTDCRAPALRALTERVSRYVIANDPAVARPLAQDFAEELLGLELCDATDATRAGIALEEAILNGVYHGNLEIGGDVRPNCDGTFEGLVARRRQEAPYRDRRVRVSAELRPDEARFAVADEGPGFDATALPNPADPANLELPSGRGLMFMRMFMDEVSYNPAGNAVTLVKRRDPRPEVVVPGTTT